MMFFLFYILMVIGFCLWDSWIGMGVNWEYGDAPPLGLAAVLCPITIPIVAIMAFSNYLDRAKHRRWDKEKQKQKLRIAAQKELDTYLEQIENEMKNIVSDTKKS